MLQWRRLRGYLCVGILGNPARPARPHYVNQGRRFSGSAQRTTRRGVYGARSRDMKSWGLRRYTVAIGAAALLAGCGGASPSIGAPRAMPQSRVIPTHTGPSRPWMLPDSKGRNLLYAASSDIVDVYTYPDGKRCLHGRREPLRT